MEGCWIIAPRQKNIVGYREDGYLAECILPRHNSPYHVIRTPEGAYFKWQDDFECGCCTIDEDQRCTEYEVITEDEAQKLIEEAGRE